MQSNSGIAEFTVGCFILAGVAALALLATQASQGGYANSDGYHLTARFRNIGQLKAKAPVRLAGVSVGQVEKIEVDMARFDALVTLNVNHNYNNLPADTSAGIYTSGLLGEQYVSLEPGNADELLAEGDEILITSSAVVLEDLIGQFLYNQAGNE